MAKGGTKLTGSLNLNQPKYSGKSLAGDEKNNRKKISFSFEYFKQIEYFGVGDQNGHWFVSLLDRLKDLSGKTEELFADYTAKSTYRIHPISWDANNVPIKREDLDWIPKKYLNNEDDYPMLQFELSMGKGRVVGFPNETSDVFHVVLLDPKHNIQPSKRYGYKVDKTSICLNQNEMLRTWIERNHPEDMPESIANETKEIVFLEDELVEMLEALISDENGLAKLKEDFTEFLENKYIES